MLSANVSLLLELLNYLIFICILFYLNYFKSIIEFMYTIILFASNFEVLFLFFLVFFGLINFIIHLPFLVAFLEITCVFIYLTLILNITFATSLEA